MIKKTLIFSALLAVQSLPMLGREAPTPDSVADALRRAAEWQLAHPSGTPIDGWIIAPLYDGLLLTARTLDEPAYMAEVVRLGHQAGWAPAARVRHADDIGVGHAWLDIYGLDKSRPERLRPIKDRVDFLVENPVTEAVSFTTEPVTPGVKISDRWTWCDALYVAPPTFSRLHAVTGDPRYLDFLYREFKYTYDQLWDPEEQLFYRDTRFIGQKTPNGKKVFWGRGNGWVFAGLALMLDTLPEDEAHRDFYETLFKELAESVVATQQADGLWRPSLLDPEAIPHGETSGSGFLTYGLAWGLNQGLLEGDTYREAALLGWRGLETTIGPDGFVGFVQPVAAAPDAFSATSTADYGTGALLLAGSEIYKLVGGKPAADPADVLARAEELFAHHPPTAYARLVPERLDDLAWENDKVAFRIYGPALADDSVTSGIDVWAKRVPDLILDKWYRLDLAGEQSYHEDHGEGYDGYHVGPSRGCGGLGLWIDGKIVTSNVYTKAEILWSAPDVAKFHVVYRFPSQEGDPIWEHRTMTLRAGEHLFEVESIFSQGDDRWKWEVRNTRLANHPIAVGLAVQSEAAAYSFDPDAGIFMLWDAIDDTHLGTGAVFDPESVVSMNWIPGGDAAAGADRGQMILQTDDQGRLHYRAGFAWSQAGEITTPEAWRALLESIAHTTELLR